MVPIGAWCSKMDTIKIWLFGIFRSIFRNSVGEKVSYLARKFANCVNCLVQRYLLMIENDENNNIELEIRNGNSNRIYFFYNQKEFRLKIFHFEFKRLSSRYIFQVKTSLQSNKMIMF